MSYNSYKKTNAVKLNLPYLTSIPSLSKDPVSTEGRLTREVEEKRDSILHIKTSLSQKNKEITYLKQTISMKDTELEKTVRIIEEILKTCEQQNQNKSSSSPDNNNTSNNNNNSSSKENSSKEEMNNRNQILINSLRKKISLQDKQIQNKDKSLSQIQSTNNYQTINIL